MDFQLCSIKGRLITDNVLLAYELFHTINKKCTGKKGVMTVKLDMSKAYDRAEWGFIEGVMEKMGFACEWVELLRRCITKVSYARGTLFSHENSSEMRFDQRSKSNSNSTVEEKEMVSRLLGVRVATNPEKYLGLPNMIGRRKKESFQNLLDRISMRIEGWSNRMLSLGGKEVFIKSVLQAIPIFAMSCFLLPNSLCKKMDSIFAKFWWKKGKGKKGLVFYRKSEVFSLTGSIDNKVDELINCQTREWNREVVECTFGAVEAEKILCIPLAKHPHDDFMAWRGEPTGDFSVKSTYKLLQSFDPSAYALQLFYSDFYKKLWCMDLPTKIKIYVWKVSWNYIPTGNARIHEKRSRSGKEIAAFTRNYVTELDGANPKVVKISKVASRWQHPPYQTVKINFDGAFDMKEQISASGVVVRDDKGSVIASKSRLHEKVASAFAAEALACRDAVQKSEFKAISFDFISRSVNSLAHLIATESLKNKEEIYLVGGVPIYAETQARNDSLREPD
ncbi:reverse transcriptase [Gossypium australe]|uniref:Reverse transcriptase n=1 Tax=Gossypium australe TaxID=47621 RepID=A0A5B6WWX6_9ROSI|nr:reverse transcriptase [Gossypium australe]